MEGNNTNPYLISLDKMDHNFLTGINLNTNHGNGTVPIWCNTNYDDYCEFEIKASRIVEDEVPPTYICHICNVTVPVAYQKEHNDSTKHKTCMKITNIALQRVQHFMTEKIESTSQDLNYNSYFCPSCTVAVPLKDKLSHEISEEHVKSIRRDKFLKDFLILYINDETRYEIVKSLEDIHVEVKTDIENDLNNHTIEITTVNGSIVKVPFDNFHGYFNVRGHLQCRVCRVLVEVKHKMMHMVAGEHKNKILKPIQDVHCIRENDDLWSHCLLCNEIILDVQLHKLQPSHNDRLKEAIILNTEKSPTTLKLDKKPIVTDKNMNQPTYYCETCDLKLPEGNVKSHLKGMRHRNNLKENSATTSDGSEKLKYLFKTKDQSELMCRVCLIIVDNMIEHVNTEDHVTKYNDLLENNTLFVFGDRIHCKICNVYIMQSFELFHTSGKNHVKLLTEENAKLSTKTNESQCNKEITVLEPKTAIASISSKGDILLNKESSSTLATTSKTCVFNSTLEQNDTQAETNNVKSITKIENILDNLYEAFSRISLSRSKSVSESSYKTTEMELSDSSLKDLDNEIKSILCPICNVSVPNHESTLSDHINGKKHKNMEKALNENHIVNNEDKESSVADLNTSNTENTGYHYCQICDRNVPDKGNFISEHNNGKSHKKNENKLKENSVESERNNSATTSSTSNLTANNDNSLYYCETCKVSVPNTKLNISQHINGFLHKQEVENQQNKIEPSISNNVDNKVLNTENTTIKIHYLLKVINAHNLYCKVCKVFIKCTLAEMNSHVASVAHEENYKKVLLSNKVSRRKSDNRFICAYCNVEITNLNEIDHINGRLHVANTTINSDDFNAGNVITKVKRVRVRSKKKKTGQYVEI